jgi:hypothetical protein
VEQEEPQQHKACVARPELASDVAPKEGRTAEEIDEGQWDYDQPQRQSQAIGVGREGAQPIRRERNASPRQHPTQVQRPGRPHPPA